jgi:hypothetical protein
MPRTQEQHAAFCDSPRDPSTQRGPQCQATSRSSAPAALPSAWPARPAAASRFAGTCSLAATAPPPRRPATIVRHGQGCCNMCCVRPPLTYVSATSGNIAHADAARHACPRRQCILRMCTNCPSADIPRGRRVGSRRSTCCHTAQAAPRCNTCVHRVPQLERRAKQCISLRHPTAATRCEMA